MHWPDKFVINCSGLHIEMAALGSTGPLLENIWWTEALVEAGAW